jgi:hypothetical protein
MITRMIINRNYDWFEISDLNTDCFYISIKILDKLSKRQKLGLDYNTVIISKIITGRSGFKLMETISSSITILLSRNLIRFKQEDGLLKKMFLTPLGLEVLNEYKEVIKNEN